MSTPPDFSVVVPAHDEEAVIGRCLRVLTAGARPGELEVVVVANGCSDLTAERAREAWPEATVVELAAAGKVGALNAGDAAATAWPRIYLDADVELDTSAARAVVAALHRGPALVAAPRPRFDLDGRPWALRAFYRVWQRLPYIDSGMVGSGVYALSAEGRARFGEFPDLTADDQYVMELFAPSERATVADAEFTIHPPTTLSGLVAVRRRVYRGNRELAAARPPAPTAPPPMAPGPPPPGRVRALASLVGRHPALLPAAAVYAAVNLVASSTVDRSGRSWERDDSSRRVAAAGRHRVAYLVSRYPSVSHTFVLQEVRGVRAAGVEVDTVSVRAATAADLLSERDRQEAERTWSIRPVSPVGVVAGHLRLLASAPGAWVATLRAAVASSPPGVRARVWRVAYFAQAVLLQRELARRGVRHVHAHLANVAADLAAITVDLGRRLEPGAGWRWSFTMHGPTEFFDVGRYDLAAKVRSADLVVAISDFARSQLMAVTDEADWSKLAVVHMGADLQRWVPVERPGRGDAALRILSVGRLDPVKGQAVLVDAVAEGRRRGHDWSLTLVGEGPARGDLERRITAGGLTDVVRLAGAVGHDDLAQYYTDADVFAMASFAEGIPVVLMEAMATGLAVVATQVNGIPELVVPGETGLLVPPARADLLADALERLADPAVRRELARSGRQRVERDFDAAACAAEVAGLLARPPLTTGR